MLLHPLSLQARLVPSTISLGRPSLTEDGAGHRPRRPSEDKAACPQGRTHAHLGEPGSLAGRRL